jgi:hypothetical protein
MRAIRAAAYVACVSMSAWLNGQSPLPPGTWRITEAPAELREPISRADLIVVSMHDTFLRELKQALDRGGPSWAIGSCHIDTTMLSNRIQRQEGLAVGRTSDRLRNPMNRPRAWAKPIVEANAGLYARDVEGFAADLGNKVGVLRPMVQGPICVSCHGPAEKIHPAVSRAVPIRYPADRAIGFAEGEIRGWYWVEIPKTAR